MQILYFVAALIVQCAVSQTDVSSFGITTGSDSSSTGPLTVKLLLSWNLEQWQCLIDDTLIEDNTHYFCNSGDFEPNATLITNALSSNTYEMKIELIANNTNDAIRIASVKVLDDDTNYYEIDTFCMAEQFRYTAVGSSSLTALECCYWSDRAAFDSYAVGTTSSLNLMQISYAQFRDNVLDYPNQAHEGAIKPPKIKQIGVTTLGTPGSGSASSYSLTLHWDSSEYQWTNLAPSQPNTTYLKTFSDATSVCEFSIAFSLQMSTSVAGSVGVASIVIRDEAHSEYSIDHFCFADDVPVAQRYGSLNEECSAEWSPYDRSTYDGFIYNATDDLYVVLSQRVFADASEAQQALVIRDDIHTRYTCNTNTPRKIALFKDDMDSPTSTGWVFAGTYVAGINAVNCPGGSVDKCVRLAGHESSTTVDSSMTLAVDVSQHLNLQIQYDLSLSTMPSGKSCYLYYAFDNNGFASAQYHTSSGTALQLLPNQTYSVPTEHLDLGYTNLSIRFYNNALYNNEYCYIDHVYLFADRVIDFDACDAFDSTWTRYFGTITSGSDYCLSSSHTCMRLYGSGWWIKKQYNNINNYNSLILRVDLRLQWAVYIYYSYDDEPETLLTNPSSSPTAYSVYYPTYAPTTSMRSRQNEEFIIPDAKVCGASTLYISFSPFSSYDFTVDNLILYGNILDTADPTTSPTLIPTNPPTPLTLVPTQSPTLNPTLSPTSLPTPSPSSAPTQVPSASPTQYPTMSPSYNPTVLTAPPTTRDPTTAAPTRIPSDAPTDSPTTLPTGIPSMTPTRSPTRAPTRSPTSTPTGSPTVVPTNIPSTTPTSAPSRGPTPAPVAPGSIQCGDISKGDYNGGALTFSVNVTFDAELTFDASRSTPVVTTNSLHKLNPGGVLDNSNGDGNDALGAITVRVAAGTYVFALDLGSEAGKYAVSTHCTSESPTKAPTYIPTDGPSSTPTDAPSRGPTNDPTLSPTNIPTLRPSQSPTEVPTGNPTDAPTDIPTDAPTDIPTDAPTDNPTDTSTDNPTDAPTAVPVEAAPTKKPNSSPVADSAQYYTECDAFNLEIISSLNPPQLMYKNVLLLGLIINSTKRAIFDNIRMSYTYNVSQFGDPWNSFVVYSLEQEDLDDGVDFSMEHCSRNRSFTDFISHKMQLDNEIALHAQWLLRTNEPLNIPNAMVRITSIEGSQSLSGGAVQKMDSDNQQADILLACVISLAVLLFLVAVVIVLHRLKYKRQSQQDDGTGDGHGDADPNNAPVPGNERNAVAEQRHPDGDDNFEVSARAVEMQVPVQEARQQQAAVVTNQQQQNGEHEGEVNGLAAEAQNPFDIDHDVQDDPLADFDIVSDLNRTVFD